MAEAQDDRDGRLAHEHHRAVLGLRAARRGDTVIIAGKGHETYQIIGEKTIPFDDRVEAKKVLDELAAYRKE